MMRGNQRTTIKKRVVSEAASGLLAKGFERFNRMFFLCLSMGALLNSGYSCTQPEADRIPDSQGAWNMYGKDYSNTRYSPLKQINTDNVGNLKAAWIFSLGILEAQESTLIVVDSTLYVTTAYGPKYVYALDAKTGAMRWKREFEMPEDIQRFACCGIVNRGVAFADGKVFVGRLDGHLTALDAQTGDVVWDVAAVDYMQGSVITSPPLIVGNKVITGFGGGEYGVRGYLIALDVNTGEEIWKSWMIPGPGEPGNDTWKGDSWRTGGAAAWFVGSYDPALNLIYWGTSNPSPWSTVVRGPDQSDYGPFTNLYSASTVALDPETGAIRWHYQSTPYDAWDYDGVNELVLADLTIDGEEVPVLMKADRNGFFYVLHRATGKLISAEPFVPTNWAERIDLETGLPVENPEKRPTATHRAHDIHPSAFGGKNWQPMSYNPSTGLVYIPATDVIMDMEATEVDYLRGYFYIGAEVEMRPGPSGNVGELIAWDPVKQEKVWGAGQQHPIHGGTMTTGGGLVFYGGLDGIFRAYGASDGTELWHFNAGSGIYAAPMTYAVEGQQYVAVTVGRPTGMPGVFGAELGGAMVEATPPAGMLQVFALPD